MRANSTTTVLGRTTFLVPYARKHVSTYHSWMESEELREATASERLSLEEEEAMQRSWAEEDASGFQFLVFRLLSFFSFFLPRSRGLLTAKYTH